MNTAWLTGAAFLAAFLAGWCTHEAIVYWRNDEKERECKRGTHTT